MEYAMRTIHKLKTGEHVYFAQGKFDDWCVYVDNTKNAPYAPRDTEYFTTLQTMGKKYGPDRIYDDFVAVYDATRSTIQPEVLTLIERLTAPYGADAGTLSLTWVVIYAGMVAEENKQFAVLGKRIKRLGVHQVLKEGMAPGDAAVFSKGKKARTEIAPLCTTKGF
jgi:hypothetical protein